MTRRPAAGMLAVLVFAMSAACGRGAPSKQDFLAKADPLCRVATSEATALTTPTDVASLRHFHIRLAEGAEKTAGELDQLKFPGGDDGKAARSVVQSLRDAATAARAVAPEVDKSNYGGIEAVARTAAEAFRAADSQARTLGSRECGRGEADAVERMSIALPKTVKGAYITAIDALCKAAWLEYEKITEEPDSLAEVKVFFEKSVAIDEKLINDIKAVPAPTVDKDKLDAMMAAYDKALAKEKELVAVAATGKEREVDDVWTLLDTLTTEAEQKADAYGSVECGSQPS